MEKKAQKATLLDGIYEVYSAPEQDFSVFLDKGEEFRFKALKSLDDIRELAEAGRKWFRTISGKNVTGVLKAVRPRTEEVAMWVYFLHNTCLGARGAKASPSYTLPGSQDLLTREQLEEQWLESSNDDEPALTFRDWLTSVGAEEVPAPEEPYEKLSQADWCRLAKRTGFVVQYLFNEVNKRQTNVASEAEVEEYETLGEGSEQTSSGETD